MKPTARNRIAKGWVRALSRAKAWNSRSSLNANQPVSPERAAHTLKGALSAVAANRAAMAADRLDRLARGGDLSDVDRAHTELQDELKALLPELNATVAEAGRSPAHRL